MAEVLIAERLRQTDVYKNVTMRQREAIALQGSNGRLTVVELFTMLEKKCFYINTPRLLPSKYERLALQIVFLWSST
ncbi:MAG: hypothetical protein SAK29_21220, partial [Scytonema sp. PMC 1069.18]|nr:hypothetical protein [Scytonema sp. PMC 1069.18]MEC4887076.1 hypothetical protein [Scytonema sp. PMC 1070.18]